MGASNPSTDVDAVTAQADLTITKDDAVSSVVAGTSTTYEIGRASCRERTETAGVVVKDTDPAGTTPSNSDADCVLAGQLLTCRTSAALAPGASKTYHLTLAVAAGHAPGAMALQSRARNDT